MRIPVGIVVALIMVSHAAFGASEFTIEQRQAAMIHERLMQWEGVVVSGCSGRLGDSGNAAAPYIFYIWRGEELKYDLVKDLVWSSMTDFEKAATGDDAKTLLAQLASSPAHQQHPTQCDRLVRSLMGPESHFEHRYPGQAKILGALFNTHPDMILKVQQEDFTIGCVKSNYNAGNRDFTAAKPTCDCLIKGMFGHATQEELNELQGPLTQAALKEHISALTQRAMPEIQACRDNVQKGGK